MGLVRTGHSLQLLPRREAKAQADCLEFPRLSFKPPPHPVRMDRTDWVFAGLLALSVAILCLLIARSMPSFLFQSMDFWFEADTLREISNMSRVHDDHYRTSVHPLFSLITSSLSILRSMR